MLYRNNGNGIFSDSFITLPEVRDSSAAWADYDHDGDLDLVLAGLRANRLSTWLFANDGRGQFSEVATALPGIYEGAVAWGDVDNDGWLDLLLAGHTSGPDVTAIFRNDGAGNFLPVGGALPGLWRGDVRWGDFDHDCDLDLLITGSDPPALRVRPPFIKTRVRLLPAHEFSHCLLWHARVG
jgi:hypothetical protein